MYSVAALITNKTHELFVSCKAPKNQAPSIPKGSVEVDEDRLEAVCREVFEETGLVIYKENIVDFC